MNRTARTTLAIALTLSLAPLAQAADLPAARKLIDAHIAAVGGREALAASNEGTTKVQMEFVENGMKMDITQYGRGADRATVSSIPGVAEFTGGYVDGVAWAMDPMNGPRLLQDKERDQTIEMSDTRYATYDASVIASAKTVALSDSEGRPCYRVEIKWVSGRETAACFGTEDGLMLSSESTIASPSGDIKQVMHMYDYKPFGKLKMSTRGTAKAFNMTQRVTLVSYDPATPSAEVFALPPAIQALLKKTAGAEAGAQK